MRKLLVAGLMVVLSTPAFAAIQNVKVSGDITSTFVDRNNFDLGDTVGTDGSGNWVNGQGTTGALNFQPVGLKKQNVFVTQTRVRVDADLSDNVSTTVGLINERAWGAEGAVSTGYTNLSAQGTANGQPASTQKESTDVQLYLASVTMRELLYSPLTVTVGRQVFNYGNGLILGDGGANNLATGDLQYIAQDLTERTSYDGVKAILDYKPLTIDMFYFKNQQNQIDGNPNSDETNSDVYGINANYQLSDPWSTVVESYLFTRFDGKTNFAAQASPGVTTDKADTLYVPGLRASTNPIKGLNVQGEVAWQQGNHPEQLVNAAGTANYKVATEHRDAMAAQFLASYSLPILDKYKPTLNASYTYVSGDKHINNDYRSDYTAWDPFNEIQGSGTIYNTIFPLTNMEIVSAGASVNPLEDVTVAATWSGLWAPSYYSAGNPLILLQPDGGNITLQPITKAKRNGLGNEYDVNLTYNYTEDVTFGVSLGWFVPGTALSEYNKDTASQALASVGVKF
jgi:hypothetical protein